MQNLYRNTLVILFTLALISCQSDQRNTKENTADLDGKATTESTLDKTNEEEGKKKVWIDADVAVGMKRYEREDYSDVDDGFAILQLFKAENIEVKGMSAVFGNTRIDDAYRLSQKMVDDFAPYEIPVFKGAGKAITLDEIETNDAVEALAEALKKEPLHILAIGPATNIATLVLLYPELKSQIKEVVLVAGRRTPTSYFEIGKPEVKHAPDLNFDLDNDAFRVLLENEISVVLCPFEISNKVWITQKDLGKLSEGDPASKWMAKESQPWLQQWQSMGENGFNPFDVLASHYLIAPEDIIQEDLNAHLEIHPNDMKLDSPGNHFKNYLLCNETHGSTVTYCYDVVEDYHEKLMESLLK
ncbi:nucleoside hydrolase [Psychroflexus lacisalsi]|uniref:Inosine/uridine-preferring nucleoside hydrolase domain-containing protein n=1 Tax=Psychroflexus lacisalsi TaxID=503928 RepID=A0ABN1K0D5_9FLAO|nr:nucleoside hydrolase [Psychroflexus lacisalsi]MBZ9620952.1 nucleoside hydrolase [Psychroflexus lacisalsi]